MKMPQQNSSPDVPEREISNERADAEFLGNSSQIEFLQPFKDSQDSSYVASTQDGAAGQSYEDVHSFEPVEVNYITRPTIETTEEIAAAFRYQPPPGRIFPQKAGKTQKVPVTATSPTGNKSSEGGSSSTIKEFPDPGNQQRNSLPSRLSDNLGQPKDVIPPNSLHVEPASSTSASRDVQERDIPCTRAPTPNAIDLVDDDTSNVPFPDESLNETSLPHLKEKKYRSPRSSFMNTQLPKHISDTRRKALATMPTHNRSPRRKSSLSHSTSSEHQSTQEVETSIKRTHPQTNQRQGMAGRTLNTDELENGHPDKTEHTSRKHHSDGRRKRNDFTRPVTVESPDCEPMSMMRPCSQASNISKLRAPLKMHLQQRTPTREQNSLNLIKFAKSWNTNYLYNQRLLDRWEQKMIALEERITEQDSTIEQYQHDLELRDQTIDILSAKEEDLRAQNQKIQKDIAVSSVARKKLEDKLRTCRTRLNDAINEQQQLFLRCKENCEKATVSIQVDEQAHKESLEKAIGAVELVRADIKQKIASVIDDANGQVESLNNTIESLETQLIEREKELERERQHALDLNNQLTEFRNLNEQSIQSIARQNLELLEKIQSGREHDDNRDVLVRKQDEKIDGILEILEETRSKTVDPKALVENLEGFHNAMTEKMVVGVQNAMDSHRDLVLADRETLNEKLGEIRLLCNGICERVTDANGAAEWQGRAHDAEMTIHTHIQNIQELQDEINQMYIRSNEDLQEREELRGQLAGLQNAAIDEQAANEKAESLAEEIDRLKEMLNERDTRIMKFSEDLEAAREELRLQARILQGKEEHIRRENELHQKAIELNVQHHKQSILQAVSETTKELSEKTQATEKQLHEALTARAQLEHELAELRQEAEISNQANQFDESFEQIRGELVQLIISMTGLTTGLQESEHEREALQSGLGKWLHDRGELGQMRSLLSRLAKDQPNAIKMGEQLRELLETQKRLSGSLEYHQAGLASSEVAISSSGGEQNSETFTHPENGHSAASGLSNDAVHSQEASQNLRRKVVVKSPANDDDPALPMSVEEERNTRRYLQPLRGIMKVATRNNSGEQETEGVVFPTDSQRPIPPQLSTIRRIAKRGSKAPLTTHSLYNRPVAGSIPRISSDQIDQEQSNSGQYREDNSIESSMGNSEIAEVGDTDEPPQKRQRINGAHIAHRVKISHSMSAQLSVKKPNDLEPEETSSKLEAPALRGGPIERGPSSLVTYGSQGLRIKRP